MDAGEADIMSVGGFALCRTLSYYGETTEKLPTINALSSSLDIIEEVGIAVCSMISICPPSVKLKICPLVTISAAYFRALISLPIRIPLHLDQSELPWLCSWTA